MKYNYSFLRNVYRSATDSPLKLVKQNQWCDLLLGLIDTHNTHEIVNSHGLRKSSLKSPFTWKEDEDIDVQLKIKF